ncbi:MAG: putative addiction module antidote protein [Giesbergeria sp.]|uniref:addiction module antidote protein n=1 Tax=Giesbergeria sp. TaxID=2818473 RepID=UPI00263749A6|nr:addiction module antidote protein [Giesbergeria sp.]MDD2608324.1 putative addiction module antidote protein [Giesbergeria sp.]
MTEKRVPFDIARYLDSEEAIAEYLTQVLADGDADELLCAIGHIAKAKGMAQVAKDAGLGRESLYKALAPGSKPCFDTILRVTRALGVTFTATSTHANVVLEN